MGVPLLRALPVPAGPVADDAGGSARLGPGQHEIHVSAAALRADEAFGPLADCGLGAVARGLLGRIGLDPMLTIAAPHDEPDLGGGGPAQRHRRAAVGLHLLAAARSPIAVGGADRRTDDDLDVGAQPPGLGGQILDLLVRTGAGGEQHDTMAHDREVPTHASASINASEESSSPRHLPMG